MLSVMLSLPVDELKPPVGRDVLPIVKQLGKVEDFVIDSLTEIVLNGKQASLKELPKGSIVTKIEISKDGTRVKRLEFKHE